MKTIVRILFDRTAKKNLKAIAYPLLDIGGGRKSSYLKYLDNAQRYVIDCNQRYKSYPNTIIMDLDKNDINIKNKFNTILAYNFFEHVFAYNKILANIKKIMNKNSRFHMFIPFLVPVHPDPKDYLRFTKDGLKKIIENNSLKIIKYETLGGYFVVLLQYMQYFPLIGRVFVFLFPLAELLDFITKMIFGNKYLDKFVLGYYVIAKKE